MLLYRIALQRLIEYLKLDQLFKESETRLLLLQKKSKPVFKTALKTDQTLNFYISVLLSIIGILVCLSIPFAALESPCEIFLENDIIFLYNITKWIEANLVYIDCLIIICVCALVLLAASTVIDAIKNTNINVSPWIERGRYTSHPRNKHRNRRNKTY